MDRASVAAAVSVVPAAAVALTWDAASTAVTIRPAATWTPATLYSVTVGIHGRRRHGPSARRADASRVRDPGGDPRTIEPTAPLASGVAVRTGLSVTFDHPVDVPPPRLRSTSTRR